MSKLNNIDPNKKVIKDNRLSFAINGDDESTIKTLKEELREYVELELINKIDTYKLVNSHIAYVRFSVEMNEKNLNKLTKKMFAVVPESVKKMIYKGKSGDAYEFINPAFTEKTKKALALLDEI